MVVQGLAFFGDMESRSTIVGEGTVRRHRVRERSRSGDFRRDSSFYVSKQIPSLSVTRRPAPFLGDRSQVERRLAAQPDRAGTPLGHDALVLGGD
jgi:hypothetical protein